MKTICFAGYHEHAIALMGKNDDGGTRYGYKVFTFAIELAKRMQQRGYRITNVLDEPIDKADIAVFFDVTPELMALRETLPPSTPCILMAIESPLYCPVNHNEEVIHDKRWSGVITLNNSFHGPNIFYTTIPANNISILKEVPPKKFVEGRKGVVIKSNSLDVRLGYRKSEIAFVAQLAANDLVDIYGKMWPVDPKNNVHGPTDNKLKVLLRYDYTFISENILFPGFLTEKIGDAILAGIPSIYYGAWKEAEERFPGCFVPLRELDLLAFIEARQQLYQNYDMILANIRRAFAQRESWNDPFYAHFEKCIDLCEEKMRDGE